LKYFYMIHMAGVPPRVTKTLGVTMGGSDKNYIDWRARAAQGRHVATHAKRIKSDMYNIHTPTHGAGKAGVKLVHDYIEGRRFFEDLVWHYSWLLARTYSDGVAAILFAGHLLYYPAWALRRHNAARHDEATSYFATANTAHDGTNAGLIFSVYVNLFDCTTW